MNNILAGEELSPLFTNRGSSPGNRLIHGSARRIMTIVRSDLRVLRRDSGPVIALVAMPIGLMLFLQPALRVLLRSEGYGTVSGAEQAVPGMAVMFSFFIIAYTGYGYFREHGWGTWLRLRTSPAATWEVIAGKSVSALCVAIAQATVLFGVGVLAFRLDLVSPAAIAAVVVAFCLCLVAMGTAVAAVARTLQHVDAAASLCLALLAALGGAVVPLADLPAWARAVAPASPAYWAMTAYQSVILNHSVDSVYSRCGVLLAFAAVFGLVAFFRFNAADSKVADM